MKKCLVLILLLTVIFSSLTVPTVSFAAAGSYFPLSFDDWTSVDTSIIEHGGTGTSASSITLSEEGRTGKALKFTQATINSKWRFKNAFENLTEGESYIVSMYVKSGSNKTGDIYLGIYGTNANAIVNIALEKISSDKWTLLKGTFSVDSSTLGATKIGIIQKGTSNDDMIGDIIVDDVNVVKIEASNTPEIDTPLITNYNFDSWNAARLSASFTTGGGQNYDGVALSFDSEKGGCLSVSKREHTYNRVKLMNVAKHPSKGSQYKYTAYVKIGVSSTANSAKISMGVADLNITNPVYYEPPVEINKNSWTKIEFTYTLKTEKEDSISFEQEVGSSDAVLEEYLVDDVTVECIYRAPEFKIDVDETEGGYKIKTELEYYYSGNENKLLTIQPIAAKYGADGLLDIIISDKKTFDNNSSYPYINEFNFNTAKLNNGEFLKVFPMSSIAGLYSYSASYKYDPFDPAFNQKTLYLIGDSIVADYSDKLNEPTRGWGMYIGDEFNENDIIVNNLAVRGYSTKSYLQTAGMSKWLEVKNNAEKGDYIIVCLGINDLSSDNSRKTTAEEYKANIQKFIDDMEGRGVTMIFMTLTATVGSEAPITNFRRERADLMIEVLEENNHSTRNDLYCLDLNEYMFSEMERLVAEMGYDAFKAKYFSDNTHQTEFGSRWVLSMIMELLGQTDCSINNFKK